MNADADTSAAETPRPRKPGYPADQAKCSADIRSGNAAASLKLHVTALSAHDLQQTSAAETPRPRRSVRDRRRGDGLWCGHPRRKRRGLIESGRGHVSAGCRFRPAHPRPPAATSLKLAVDLDLASDGELHIRGGNAAASLKLGWHRGAQRQQDHIRGGNAAPNIEEAPRAERAAPWSPPHPRRKRRSLDEASPTRRRPSA